jgi:hypothetical protein
MSQLINKNEEERVNFYLTEDWNSSNKRESLKLVSDKMKLGPEKFFTTEESKISMKSGSKFMPFIKERDGLGRLLKQVGL